MRLFTRGAQKRLATSMEVPGQKSWTGFLDDELYAAHVEIARLQQQVADLLPAALVGSGVMSGSIRYHVTHRARRDRNAERLRTRILAGEFGEVQ